MKALIVKPHKLDKREYSHGVQAGRLSAEQLGISDSWRYLRDKSAYCHSLTEDKVLSYWYGWEEGLKQVQAETKPCAQ